MYTFYIQRNPNGIVSRVNWLLYPNDVPVTETQTQSEIISFRKTHTETITEKILETETI